MSPESVSMTARALAWRLSATRELVNCSFSAAALYAMFRFFPASIELRQQPFLWAEDLSSYDSILNIGSWHLSLFALLMAVTMFFYSKMNSKSMSDDPNMAPMKRADGGIYVLRNGL